MEMLRDRFREAPVPLACLHPVPMRCTGNRFEGFRHVRENRLRVHDPDVTGRHLDRLRLETASGFGYAEYEIVDFHAEGEPRVHVLFVLILALLGYPQFSRIRLHSPRIGNSITKQKKQLYPFVLIGLS